MKRVMGIALLLIAAPLLAAEVADPCGAYMQLGALYEVRSLMMKPYASSYDVDNFINGRVEQLRDPLPDGGYRWVRWIRPDGDAPIDKHGHTVVAVQGSNSDPVEASGQHAFAVRIAVPAKKSLFSRNNAVYVGNVHVTYTVNGRTRTKDEKINQWMNPDTSRTIDLGAIADRTEATLDASTSAANVKESLVEIHFVQAIAQDDPANPAYDTIRSLERVRRNSDAYSVDNEIAKRERELFPGAEPLPLLSIVADLHRADELLHSKKDEDYEKGMKLLRETMRKVR
ncbi:MAG TPA: hypothetical protein VGQ21_20240 [Thermoanaerobaculia bacterium]|jgi:hypothetical protein|nr:hypothetical protein [Thermoanaerobaculia bacterium]